MPSDTLDFEEPVGVLLKEIEAMRLMPQTADRRAAIARLEARANELRAEIYAHLDAVAGRPGRASSQPADDARLHRAAVSELHGARTAIGALRTTRPS